MLLLLLLLLLSHVIATAIAIAIATGRVTAVVIKRIACVVLMEEWLASESSVIFEAKFVKYGRTRKVTRTPVILKTIIDDILIILIVRKVIASVIGLTLIIEIFR